MTNDHDVTGAAVVIEAKHCDILASVTCGNFVFSRLRRQLQLVKKNVASRTHRAHVS